MTYLSIPSPFFARGILSQICAYMQRDVSLVCFVSYTSMYSLCCGKTGNHFELTGSIAMALVGCRYAKLCVLPRKEEFYDKDVIFGGGEKLSGPQRRPYRATVRARVLVCNLRSTWLGRMRTYTCETRVVSVVSNYLPPLNSALYLGGA